MKKIVAFALLAFASCAFAQENKPQTKEKHGMSWYFFNGGKKCNADLDAATKARTDSFKALDEKVKTGDPAKVRLYMSRARDAQFKMDMAWACGSDYARNLERHAGVALNTTDDISVSGRMTEPQYDEAMALVKTLQAKIKVQPLPEEYKKVWAAAANVVGIQPDESSYTSIFKTFVTCPGGAEPVNGICSDDKAK